MDVRLKRERKLPDTSFDIVSGPGNRYHLDFARFYAEIPRTLEPADAAGIFTEPLGQNSAINANRKRTPTLRHPRSSEVEGVYHG